MSSSPGPRAVGPPPDPGLLSLYDEALAGLAAHHRAYVTTEGNDD